MKSQALGYEVSAGVGRFERFLSALQNLPAWAGVFG